MRALLLTLLFVGIMFTASAQSLRITSVNPNSNEITLTNFGAGEDFSTFRLCSLFEYETLNSSDISIVSGDFDLAMGESVSITWQASNGMDPSGADLGLYLPSGGFGSAASMVDFVQWGSGGNGREGIAVSAGLWATGTFLNGDAPYTYTGDGIQNGINFWESFTGGGETGIVINEVDSDNLGSDTMEFVELFGEPNESLDGMVLVFINGNDNSSYYAADLDGFSLNDEGFFLIANSGVAGADIVFDDGSLQNGPEAVALYFGDDTDWENGTEISADNLIDMVVYDTGDADDLDLLAFLNEGQAQVDEWSNGFEAGQVQSSARVPDGGIQLNTDTYVQQDPTPGFSNQFDCAGAIVTTEMEETEIIACVNEAEAVVNFNNNSSADAEYVYVITDESNIIIEVLSGNSKDFSGEDPGIVRVWGLSYTGTLDSTTTEPGDDATMAAGDGCLSLSNNFITITLEDCTPASCDGATISSDSGDGPILACLDDEADNISFSNNSQTDGANYLYLITDESNVIVDSFESGTYDFNNGTEQICRVWGLSYTGTLASGSTDPGMSATEITTDGDCVSLSENFIIVIKQECVSEGGCTDLFFSEYLEGSSNNKALEIYNPTEESVDLSEYEVLLYPNGNTEANNTLIPSGTLAPGEVFVIANSNASPIIQAQADVTATVTFFNGNDALELLHNGVVIDVIGTVGDDPGDDPGWTVGEGATSEFTLVRKIEVTEGTDNWLLGATQWDVFPQDNTSNLGNHTTFPCEQVPQITFTASNLNVEEGAGTLEFSVQAFNLESDLTATISLASATATEMDDYELTLPITVNFTTGNNEAQSYTVTIIDDLIEEDTENIVLQLSNEDGIEVNTAELTIQILDNDAEIPALDISEVTGTDEFGAITNDGLECELRGIVHGVNLRPGGLQFTLIDPTDGIGVFNSADDLGYTVTEGDSIHVVGVIEQFNGLSQINITELTFISADNEINEPEVVTELNEDTESEVVRLECFSLVDPSQWVPEEPGFNVDVTDGVNQYTVRIDADVDLYTAEAPEGTFIVSGIGGQFDSESPFDSGYQLLPRYAEDIIEGPISGFEVESELIDGCLPIGLGGLNLELTGASSSAESWSWTVDYGSGELTSDQFSVQFEEILVEDPETITITHTVTLNGCTVVTEEEYCVLVVGVEERAIDIKLYPNPVKEQLTVESNISIESYRVLNMTGQVVIANEGRQYNRLDIPVSELVAGVYFVELNTDYGLSTKRFIKE